MAGENIQIPTFSALNQFVDPMAQVGKFASEYANRIQEQNNIEAEKAFKKQILDEERAFKESEVIREQRNWDKTFAYNKQVHADEKAERRQIRADAKAEKQAEINALGAKDAQTLEVFDTAFGLSPTITTTETVAPSAAYVAKQKPVLAKLEARSAALAKKLADAKKNLNPVNTSKIPVALRPLIGAGVDLANYVEGKKAYTSTSDVDKLQKEYDQSLVHLRKNKAYYARELNKFEGKPPIIKTKTVPDPDYITKLRKLSSRVPIKERGLFGKFSGLTDAMDIERQTIIKENNIATENKNNYYLGKPQQQATADGIKNVKGMIDITKNMNAVENETNGIFGNMWTSVAGNSHKIDEERIRRILENGHE